MTQWNLLLYLYAWLCLWFRKYFIVSHYNNQRFNSVSLPPLIFLPLKPAPPIHTRDNKKGTIICCVMLQAQENKLKVMLCFLT